MPSRAPVKAAAITLSTERLGGPQCIIAGIVVGPRPRQSAAQRRGVGSTASARRNDTACIPLVVDPLVARPRRIEVGDREPVSAVAARLNAAGLLEDVVLERDVR